MARFFGPAAHLRWLSALARRALRAPPPAEPYSLALRAAVRALWRAASMARNSGSAMRLRRISSVMRLRPAALHSLEQYRTMRFSVENFLPHSLQFRVLFLAISLSTLALHRLQWIGRRPPYGANLRPHSAHGYGSAGVALGFRLLAPRLSRGGFSPRSAALRAADALASARFLALLWGSARYLRWLSALARRAAAERHSTEQ